MNPEHKHHFNKCVECGKEPDLTYTPLTSEVTLSCPGQCARLCITCIGFDLAETLWNAANPANVSHATAFSENPEIHEWKHGGDPEPEDPATDKETADENERYYDRQFDLYNIGREIDVLRERIQAASHVGSIACIDNESPHDVDAFQYIISALSQIRAGLDWIETEVKK